MLVYRIEDSNGYGAFNGLASHHDRSAFEDGLRTAYSHPGARDERERDTALQKACFENHSNFRFGCRSLPQLRMWFRSARGRDAMAKDGGVLVTYWVDEVHVRRGRYQLTFDKTKATRVEVRPANAW